MRITSSETIYDALKNEIIFLRRKPGDEISPQEVSERFDVSRSPVRDALMRLRSDALVVMRPQRGCWVSRIDLGKVEDERFFRLALERSAIERFKDYMKSSDITRIEYFIELQKEALESGDIVGFYNADDDMHAIFFEATGLSRIWQLILRETSNHRRMRILSMGSDEILKTNLEQHQAIAKALSTHDFDSALAIEAEHLSKLRYESKAIIEAHPEYFIYKEG